MKMMYSSKTLKIIHRLKKIVTAILMGSIAIFMALAMLAYSQLIHLINRIYILCGENASAPFLIIAGVIVIAILLNLMDSVSNT